ALTRQVVAALDRAEAGETVRIAMTRVVLKPIYLAIKRAAKRGVSVKLALNMENYDAPDARAEIEPPAGCQGDEAYAEECSVGINFAYLLHKGEFPGAENVSVRIKYFNLDPRNYLGAQLHAKYFIVGD